MAKMSSFDKPAAEGAPLQGDAPDSWDWWRVLASELPQGLFIVAVEQGIVKLNPALAALLEIPGVEQTPLQEFWNRIEDLAANPDQTHLLIENAINQLREGRTAMITIHGRSGVGWRVGLFPLPPAPAGKNRYGGWMLDRTQEMDLGQSRIRLLAEICTQSRISAAAASGNLSALLENIQIWSPEVQADFLKTAADQILHIQQSLDLALSYAGLVTGIPVYREESDLVQLLNDLSRENAQIAIRIVSDLPDGKDLPPGEIDPALSRLALETILQEISRRQPAGAQIDALLSSNDQYLVLKLLSPRTLPLPGLDAEGSQQAVLDGSPKLQLVRELLSIQGGEISIQNRPYQDGGGVDIEIHLPLSRTERQSRPGSLPRQRDGERGRILLAESQSDYQVRLRDELTAQGHRVDLAVEGSTALDMVQTINPDLVILARNLPGMDGLLVTQGIRRWSDVPIIMISSRLNQDDQLYAYQLGVDDYLRKPLLIEELLAKVQVFISRRRASQFERFPEVYQSGSVRIDHTLRKVWVRGEQVDLTPIEYNLLVYLARHGRQIIPYEQLQESVWEGPEKGSRQGLFVHIRRLREKIELDPEQPNLIRNKWGVGYLFYP